MMPKPLYPHGKIKLNPKPKRPLGRSKMTIAAGFVCLDGIVLCADTQETISGYTKNSTEKIRIWDDRGLYIAITGAGETELIETIGQEIEKSLTWTYSPNETRLPDEVREIIRSTMFSSFQKYIAPYASFHREDRPGCDLLVVVSLDNKMNTYDCLYRASGTTVRQIEQGADCVGTGLILAKSLIERFYNLFMDVDECVLAACYIMYHTKKWVDGCGGNTDLIVASSSRKIFDGPSSFDIEALERAFESLEISDSLLLKLVNPNISPQTIEGMIGSLRDDAEETRKKLYPENCLFLDMLQRLKPERDSERREDISEQTKES